MKVTSYAVARPAYYDRNATSAFGIYNALILPAAPTIRITSTVASGKKLQLEAVGCTIVVETTASFAGRNLASMAISDGSATADLVRVDATNPNTVGAFRQDVKGIVLTLFAGEIIQGTSYDGSTGGSQYFGLYFKGSTFDA